MLFHLPLPWRNAANARVSSPVGVESASRAEVRLTSVSSRSRISQALPFVGACTGGIPLNGAGSRLFMRGNGEDEDGPGGGGDGDDCAVAVAAGVIMIRLRLAAADADDKEEEVEEDRLPEAEDRDAEERLLSL